MRSTPTPAERAGNSRREANAASKPKVCMVCSRKTKQSLIRWIPFFEPGRSAGRGLFRERRRKSLCDRYRHGGVALEIPNRRCCARFASLRQRHAFFGSWDSYFYAVDAATGKEKWRFHGGEDPAIHNQVGFQSSPAVVDGVVYTGCRDAQLYALDAATGKEKWRFDNALSWVISSPAVTQGKVFFGTSDSSLYHVVDAATGKPVLKQQDKSYMFSSPAIAGDVVLIGVLNGTLQARDLKTGDVLWNFETETQRKTRAGF